MKYKNTTKKKVERINQSNIIFNSFLRHGKAIAQQAANAYYMKGRKGVRDFVKSLQKQQGYRQPVMPDLSSITSTI